jgi:hypothetical protein
MTRTNSTLRLLTTGAMLGGAFLLAGCGSPERPATTTTTTEQSTTIQPPPVTSTTTTTTRELSQSH